MKKLTYVCSLLYEHVSGMKINFYKSEVIPFNLEENETNSVSSFSCPLREVPTKYLWGTFTL